MRLASATILLRRRGVLAAVSAIVLVAVVSALSIGHLTNVARDRQEAQLALSKLRLDLTGVSSGLLARRALPQISELIEGREAATVQLIVKRSEVIARTSGDRELARQIAAAANSFVSDITSIKDAPLTPQIATNGISSWFRVDGVLSAAEKRFDEDVETALQRAHWGTWLIILGEGLLVAIAWLSLGSARRRAERFAREADTDSLTGLLNHRAFHERLARAIDDPDLPVALVVFDLDHFKRVNDTRGHLVGDEVLVEVAARVAAMAAPGDAVGRVGGEEFAWLIAGRDDRHPAAQAERLRAGVSDQPIAETAVTVSVGVALRNDGETASALYRRTDTALYSAKAAGRNTVICAVDDAMVGDFQV